MLQAAIGDMQSDNRELERQLKESQQNAEKAEEEAERVKQDAGEQKRKAGELVSSSRASYKLLSTMNYGEAIDNLAGVNKGKEITVYYNPNKPRQSVLLRGVNLGNYCEVIFIFIFLVMLFNGINIHQEIIEQGIK